MASTAIDPDTGMPYLPPNRLWRVEKVKNLIRNHDAYTGYEEGPAKHMRVSLIERVTKIRKTRRPWKPTVEEAYTEDVPLGSSLAPVKDHRADMQQELRYAALRVLNNIEEGLRERAELAARLDLIEKVAGDYPPKKNG